MNPNRPTPRPIITKMAKVKERILKAARATQSIHYKGTSIRPSADFSTETLQARREGQDIFRILKEKKLHPRILYPAIISLEIEGEIKIFPNKQKLKEYSNTKPRLKEILKGLFLTKKNRRKGKKKEKKKRRRRRGRTRTEETAIREQSLK